MLTFKTVETKPRLKVQDLKEPLIGVYKGTEPGRYSPLYLIEAEDGLKRLVGVTDLQKKMEAVEVGATVRISLKETKTLANGNTVFVTTVEVADRGDAA